MSGRARFAWSAAAGGLMLAAVVGVGRAQGPAPAPKGAPGAAPPAAPAMPPANVKITIITVPSQKGVFVFWGKKKLGAIAPHQPLILQRPRDSGPLDLVIKCQGFVTVQTRAYTFADTKLAVKLTPIDQKNTLLGYREEVPPPSPDAGAPAAAALPGATAMPGADAGAR
jgi:hypothetical protein